MATPDETGLLPPGQPGADALQGGEDCGLPGLHRIGRQTGIECGTCVADRDVVHRGSGPGSGAHRLRWRQGDMVRRHRVAKRVEQVRREPTRLGDRVQERIRRHPRHAQHPVDRTRRAWRNRSIWRTRRVWRTGGLWRALSVRRAEPQRPVLAPYDRHDVAVHPGRRIPVQFEFAQREAPARLHCGEVEEGETHRLLQLPHRVGADEHQRDMRLGRRRVCQRAEKACDFRLVRRNAHGWLRGTACRWSSRRRPPW